jgi:proliferating cell nuclear antigen
MFSATLDDATALKKALAVAGELVDDGNFVATAAGVSFQALDSSHICVVDLNLPSECFSDLVVDETTVFGVHLGTLNRALGCSTAGKTVRIATDAGAGAGAGDALTLDFDAATFRVRLLDIDSDRVDIPATESTLTIDADSVAFQKIVKDLAAFGDVVTIRADHTTGGNTTVTMSTTGEHGTATVRVDADVTCTSTFQAEFATRFLATFAKAAGVCGRVRLETSPDMPLFVTYALGQALGQAEKGSLRFVLAPKFPEPV